MLKRNIFLFLLLSVAPWGFTDLSLVCKFVAFCDPITKSSTPPEDLLRLFGKNYSLEIHRPTGLSHHDPGNEIHAYIFASGAQFYYYYNSQNNTLFLSSWSMFPAFLPDDTYPKTMRECRDNFGAGYAYHDSCLSYSLGGGELRFRFNDENQQLEEITWSLWD